MTKQKPQEASATTGPPSTGTVRAAASAAKEHMAVVLRARHNCKQLNCNPKPGRWNGCFALRKHKLVARGSPAPRDAK